MKTEEYLACIAENIHTVVVATVDDEGLPVTAAVDIMDSDPESLYFLTAKGKGLYDRLKKRGFLAFTAVKGEDTMSSVAVSVRGKVREIGFGRLQELFAKNPYMNEIYPSAASREALTVFRIYEGSGEWFDLSKKPIERASFTFGGAREKTEGYFITDACTGCRSCAEVCPQQCIVADNIPLVISQANCLHCGNCMTVCPAGAVERRR
ncbi:MAG: 4Fe-4S binding protein [Abditibacteriota bacterium]|nr:4Fe-4S binding protein [Abditibacteriota bacterium]